MKIPGKTSLEKTENEHQNGLTLIYQARTHYKSDDTEDDAINDSETNIWSIDTLNYLALWRNCTYFCHKIAINPILKPGFISFVSSN